MLSGRKAEKDLARGGSDVAEPPETGIHDDAGRGSIDVRKRPAIFGLIGYLACSETRRHNLCSRPAYP